MLRDVLLREDRATGRDAADERQRQLHQAGMRQRELVRRVVDAEQADAARCAGGQLDHALARQCAQVLLGRIRRAEAQFGRDFGTGGRESGALDRATDQVEHLLLTGGEFGHGSTVWIDSELYFYTVLREFQALLEVRRDRAGSGAISRRPDAGSSAATVHPVCVSTFEY
ncbi:hypothetical protein EMIT0111MI5_40222 [Burkholderia sp. IT-111MI5]